MTTPTPRQILCPVDFSELSAQGLRYAVAFAQCSDARLTVLYANPFLPPPYFTKTQVDKFEKEFRKSKHAAEKNLRRFVEGTLGLVSRTVQAVVVDALPVKAIHDAASEWKADLIVMGTHGRSGVNRFMLGSVAERVLRESEIPVLTVRGELKEKRPKISIQNILCPVNNSPVARKSLGFATQLAACFGSTVTVLHVQETDAKDSIADLCAWVPESQRAQCTLREMTREGEASAEIVALATELKCDLLVLGAQHRRFYDSTIIGTTTVRVVRHAPCPVLKVVRKESALSGTKA